jgi:hypothetical protein
MYNSPRFIVYLSDQDWQVAVLPQADIFNILHPLGHLWAPVVWLRRTFHQPAPNYADTPGARLRQAWDTFRRPRGKERIAAPSLRCDRWR